MRKVPAIIVIFTVLFSSIPLAATQSSETSVNVTPMSTYAGSIENPSEITLKVTVEGTSKVFSIEEFEILIGEKPAEILSLIHEELDLNVHLYLLNIIPPKQKSPGRYDLQLVLPIKSIKLPNSITYGGGNVDIVLLIDSSGSMKQNDPRGIRKEGAKLLLSKLDSNDAVAVIEFDSHAKLLFPLSVLKDESTRRMAMEAVESVGAQGKTNMQEALDIAYECLLNSSTGNNRKVVVLLTDGYNTVGDFNETGTIKKFREMGWPIYTIALTGDADEELLRKLAEETGGIYVKANKAEDLIPVYDSIKTFIKNEISLKSESGKIKKGEVREGEIPIGEGIKSFEITAVGREIDLYLYLPNGSMVKLDEDSATGTNHGNIYYVRGEDYQFYRVIHPQPGIWKYRLVAKTDSSYHISSSASAPVRLISNVRVISKNGTAIISGVITRNGTIVKTASVKVVLRGAFGEETLPMSFTSEYSIGNLHITNAYVAVVKLDPGNYTARITAELPDGTVISGKALNFRVGGLKEIYRGEGYIVATDGISRTYLLNFKRETLWSYETGYPYVAHVHNGLVAVGSTRVYLFNVTGEPLWDYQFNSSVTAVTIGDEYVAVAVGRTVYLFTLDGRLLWERELPPKKGEVKRIYTKEDRIYVVQEKGTTVIDESGNVVGTIDVPDVMNIISYISDVLKKTVEVLVDAANNIHVYSDFKPVVDIPVSVNVTVVLPVEIKGSEGPQDYIAVGTSNGVVIYDLRGNEIGGTSTEDAVIKLVFYGEYLIAGTRNGEIYVLLIRDGTVVKEFQTGSELVDMRVVELEDGAYILAKCLDGIHLFKLEAEEAPSGGNVTYWVKTYGGSDDDAAYAVAIAPNGDIIVAGVYGEVLENGWIDKGDVWILCLDGKGNIKWQKTYGDDYWDGAYALSISKNGDIIVAGAYGEHFDSVYRRILSDAWLLRINKDGNLEWQKKLEGYEAKAVAIAENGDIIVTGYEFTMQLDPRGNIKWSTWDWGGESIALTTDGIVVAGHTKNGNALLTKFDATNGEIKWAKAYESIGEAHSVAIAPNGDIIVATSMSVGVLRLDKNGNIKWQRTYKGSNFRWAYAVAIAENGDIIVTGDKFTMRLDANGNVIWAKDINGDAVAITENGDIIIAGSYNGDVWVLRIPPDGNLPNCNFCKDLKVQVSDSNAQIRNIYTPTETNNTDETLTQTYTPSNNRKVCGPAVFVAFSILLVLLGRRKE